MIHRLVVSLIFVFFSLSAAHAAAPDSLRQLLTKGGMALSDGNANKAREYYLAVLKIDSNNIEALRNLGVVYSGIGEQQAALAFLHRAWELDSSDPAVANNLGACYSAIRNTKEAIHYYEEAVAGDSTKVTFRANLGAEYLKAGRARDGLEQLQFAAAHDTSKAEIPYLMGNCFAALKQHDSAEVYYTRALHKGSRTGSLFYYRGLARQGLRKWTEAEEDLVLAVTLDPKCRDCWQALGVTEVQQGMYEKALPRFQEVTKLDSTFHSGWVSLGVMYALTGQNPQADSVFARLMAIDTTLGYRMIDLINLENSKREKQ